MLYIIGPVTIALSKEVTDSLEVWGSMREFQAV
jgi:hypothetical protein